MIQRKVTGVILTVLVGGLLTGCMPKFTIEELKNMESPRPAELDKLNMFVGTWESTGEAKLGFLDTDKPLKATSTGKVAWECDGRYLIERSKMNMEELGDMEGMAIYAWDAKAEKFRTWWFDSDGAVEQGTAKYDEKTKTWHFKGKGRSEWGRTHSKGTAKFLDDNNMEWSFTMWDGWKLHKVMEMSGTSKRK
ncbi:MAG: DUF1579 domain-containing protein [Planctomycetes bacterium]|nr:DUF1579 domain-containing protein [Planctomycetota bacterium]